MMNTPIRSLLLMAGAALGLLASDALAQEQAPSVAVEAENFTVESGWEPIHNGEGNYMVDIIGFQHISGERLLGADKSDADARAYMDITVPEAGNYRLWVRYEYPPFSEARFRVAVQQNGNVVAEKVMGAKDNERYGFGNPNPVAQHDPSWGAEGLMNEVLDVSGLAAGNARLVLETVDQPDIQGVSANRNIDLLYLTADTEDAWWGRYAQRTRLYPILDAVRDSVGARWEVNITNTGDQASNYRIQHHYNRVPWGVRENGIVTDLGAGQSSGWTPIMLQDTAHFSMITLQSTANQPMRVQLRPAGGGSTHNFTTDDGSFRAYLPPYPGNGQQPVTPNERLREIIDYVEQTPAPGREPTLPLTYGAWLPAGENSEYGRLYAELYATIGMRTLHPAIRGGVEGQLRNLREVGIEPSRSWMIMGYRNPPTPDQIAAGREAVEEAGLADHVQWYDYGDEIHFAEWLGVMAQQRIAESNEDGLDRSTLYRRMWVQWLEANRSGFSPADYWRDAWGAPSRDGLRPDSSAEAAEENPRLYVDSVIFYEDTAIEFVAEGLQRVKDEFGEHVRGGANYSAHPFYYPTIAMYVKWFRGGAADMGRHSEYFWQVTQPGPMINGYLVEHFRAGMRHNPDAIIRQYTMPHSPGNTDASFRRTAFTHLAHGAKMLDYFGIGLNETFTENHIDHRDADRYVAIRDVNRSIGLVEDLMLESHVVSSKVAILVSDSTERWDLAPVATDRAGHSMFGPRFRETRLSYHQERVGLWKALTFGNHSPDLLVEEDLTDGTLDEYEVLYVIGDSLPVDGLEAIRAWVENGGTAMATAGAGRFDPYREQNPVAAELFGLASRTTDEQVKFMRPRQELAFLDPIGRITGDGFALPTIAIDEQIAPADGAEVIGRFDDDSPAVIRRALGDGQVYYVAGLPGVAYLWSGLQPPMVPDRGVNTHTVPSGFNEDTAALINMPIAAAGIEPTVRTDVKLIDARLIESEDGYVLPLANYQREVGQPVTVSIRTDRTISRAISAEHGELEVTQEDGRAVITIPSLEYGDLLRLEP